MKPHTNGFKENIKLFGRELDSKITYTINNEEIELGSEELNSVTPHYESSILKSTMKQLDIDSNVSIPIGTVINYQFGVKVNDAYEYLNYGNYIVYKVEKQEDTKSYKITCYDKMLLTMKDYVAMPITYPITIRDYINALCQFNFLTFANSSDTFANYNKIIPNELYLDSNGGSLGYTFRDVFDELAQVTGSTICINADDELEIRYINDTEDVIDEEYFKDINVEFGEKYGPINSVVLSRAGGSDNIYLRDEESVTENGLCEIKISDNQIMNRNDRDEYLPDILEVLDGLEYYLNDFSSTGVCYYDLCDKYNVSIGDNTYNCVMFNDEIDITQGLEEHIHTDMLEESETDYTKADKTDRKINQTYIMVDKQNGRIDAIASSVQDLTDFLKTVEGTSEITLENTVSSNGAIGKLEITGFTELGLYPGMAYPSGNVYPGKLTTYVIVQENEDGTEYNETYIDLGFPLLLTDRLIIDNNKVSVKRINGSIDTDLEVILKTFEDKTKISVKYFDNVNIKCQYIEKNDFTKYFATQTELQSQILITDQGISSKVSKAELISEINQSAEKIELRANRLVVDSDNFKLTEEGDMTAISGTVGGFGLGVEEFHSSSSITRNYTSDDVTRIREIILGNIVPTDEDFEKYDLNGDLNISTTDLLRVQKIVMGYSSPIQSCDYIINSNDPVHCLKIINTNDNAQNVSLGLFGGYIHELGINSASIYNNLTCYDENKQRTINLYSDSGNVECVSLTQTSKEENKKNFEKLENGLSIIKDTDIYKYHLKHQEDGSKKHIGLVIGENFKYSQEVTSENNDGVDTYSMVAVCFKAIQELNEKIEMLDNKLKESEK